jgi:multiple sugar transport system permease protein
MAIVSEHAKQSRLRQMTGAAPARGTTSHKVRGSDWWWGYVFILPTVLGLGVFSIWPIFQTFYFSFTTWGAFGGHDWSGLKNYQHALRDRELLQASINTLIYTGVALLSVPLAIIVAAVLNKPGLRGIGIYRTLYFLPVVTLPSAVALMWKLLYSGDYGIINWFLHLFGVTGPYWLSDPKVAVFAIGGVAVWSSLGYNMVILLAGMQAIPRDFYEAAEIDGAGGIRQFFSITVPLLTPSIFFVCVITIINALQAFDLIYLMVSVTNPALPKTETVVYLFFQRAFVDHNGGYGAAIAFILMLVVLVLTAIQFRLQKRWVHYG